MFWIIIPVVVAAAAGIAVAASSNEPQNSPPKEKSQLELNFEQLSSELELLGTFKKIAIIGQPGSGKSSLLKYVTNNQCHPQPIIGQKTDATNWHRESIHQFFNDYKNIKFVDVPGHDTNLHPLSSYLSYFPFGKFDLILFVLKNKLHQSDEKIFSHLKSIFETSISKKVICIRSFAENLSQSEKNEIQNDFDNKFGLSFYKTELFFVSNRYKSGIDAIKKEVL